MRNRRFTTLVAAGAVIILAACNRDTVVKNSITFNNDIMKVAVYVEVDGKVRKDFSREVNVAGLSTEDRGALGKKILDSLQALPEK